MNIRQYISPKVLMLEMVLFFISTNIVAQDYKDSKELLMPSIIEFFKDYQRYSQFTSDGVHLDSTYINKYKNLFDINKSIYNDLSSNGKKSFSNLEEYLQFVKTHYSQGLDISLDTNKIIIEEASRELEGYKALVLVRKEITGLYSGQKIYRFNDNLYFYLTIATNNQGKISSIKINGILSANQFAKNQQNIVDKGFYLSAYGVFGLTRIYNSTLYNESTWAASSGRSALPSLGVTMMLNSNFGLVSGVKFSTFKTSFTINNYSNKSNEIMTDIDGETYQPVLTISKLIQSNRINCFDIPFLLRMNSSNQKTKFYVNTGIILSFFSKSCFTLNGDLVKSGYYPQYGMTIEDIPEYSFGPINYSSSEKYAMKIPGYSFSGYISLGLIYMLKPDLSLIIGISGTQGLTDLKFDQKIPENYINYALSKPLKRTILQSTDIEIGINYKISNKR